MNIYTLFRQLINQSSWRSEALRADAMKLIDQLELMNAFGTFTGGIQATNHEHVMEWQRTDVMDVPVWIQRCRVCTFIDQETRTIENPNRYWR